MKNLKALTDEEALVAGLDVFAKSRDLQKNPPKDGETLQELGIGPSNLDGPVRAWINAKFRRPRDWPLFVSGDLTVDMKWSDFRKKVLTHNDKSAKALKAAATPKPPSKASPKGKANRKPATATSAGAK
ncbi:MAG: hypothetical protein GC203_03630 [Phenylobacterium sp.]|uniref:hypothetical protein n=1 Tax=Phenylobacterium sp. TaxID=1871053 RepID=UPI00260145F4|nr:hypothetical protein [Phenylobacterium sp.]MBI1196930.1 hypothetical protein [Phenylobacterium sp.]